MINAATARCAQSALRSQAVSSLAHPATMPKFTAVPVVSAIVGAGCRACRGGLPAPGTRRPSVCGPRSGLGSGRWQGVAVVRGKNVSRGMVSRKTTTRKPCRAGVSPGSPDSVSGAACGAFRNTLQGLAPASPADRWRPPSRWPTPGPCACLPPSLQLHIDDKQNASGSLKISTDHGNARYSISVSLPPAAGRDCWWNTHTFCAAHCRLAPLQHQSFPAPASMLQSNTTLRPSSWPLDR